MLNLISIRLVVEVVASMVPRQRQRILMRMRSRIVDEVPLHRNIAVYANTKQLVGVCYVFIDHL